MQRIPEVKTAVGSALVALGDGNWKMGEGIQVGKGSKVGEIDEHVITEHFIRTSVVILFPGCVSYNFPAPQMT